MILIYFLIQLKNLKHQQFRKIIYFLIHHAFLLILLLMHQQVILIIHFSFLKFFLILEVFSSCHLHQIILNIFILYFFSLSNLINLNHLILKMVFMLFHYHYFLMLLTINFQTNIQVIFFI